MKMPFALFHRRSSLPAFNELWWWFRLYLIYYLVAVVTCREPAGHGVCFLIWVHLPCHFAVGRRHQSFEKIQAKSCRNRWSFDLSAFFCRKPSAVVKNQPFRPEFGVMLRSGGFANVPNAAAGWRHRNNAARMRWRYC